MRRRRELGVDVSCRQGRRGKEAAWKGKKSATGDLTTRGPTGRLASRLSQTHTSVTLDHTRAVPRSRQSRPCVSGRGERVSQSVARSALSFARLLVRAGRHGRPRKATHTDTRTQREQHARPTDRPKRVARRMKPQLARLFLACLSCLCAFILPPTRRKAQQRRTA